MNEADTVAAVAAEVKPQILGGLPCQKLLGQTADIADTAGVGLAAGSGKVCLGLAWGSPADDHFGMLRVASESQMRREDVRSVVAEDGDSLNRIRGHEEVAVPVQNEGPAIDHWDTFQH